MTQRNYFNGAWIGCDSGTGLGLPNWEILARAFGLPYAAMDPVARFDDPEVAKLLASDGPAVIEVPIDPAQTYYPKIGSAVQPNGSMRSNPLHLMDPQLDAELARRVLPYLPEKELVR
jgi:acetolactate synthase-1/2/3 large subunit